jgi:integrase
MERAEFNIRGPRKTRSGTRWDAQWRDPETGVFRSRTFVTKLEAENHLIQVRAAKLQSKRFDSKAGKVTLGTYVAESYIPSKAWAEATAKASRVYLDNYFEPYLSMALDSFERSTIQGWVNSLSQAHGKKRGKGLKPGTVHVVYNFIRAIFRSAMYDGKIHATPCVKIQLPKRPRKYLVAMSPNEVQALIDTIPPRFKALIIFAAETGMRFSELAGLTLDHFDWSKGMVAIDRQLLKGQFRGLKSDNSRRTIELSEEAHQALSAHLAEYPALPWVDGEGEQGDLIFHLDDDRPLLHAQFNDIYTAARRASGIALHWRFHDLRHYHASVLCRRIGNGTDYAEIACRLGHSIAQTRDTYQHLEPPQSEQRVKLLNEVASGFRVKAV